MSDVRIVVVGLGLIGRRRAEALAAIDGADLVATVDPFASKGVAGVPHVARLEDVPAGYDGAVIAVPHDLAGGLAREVLASGRPVLVEKPLGTTSREAAELEHAAAAVERPSFVGYNYRFIPSVRGLIDAARSGRLGCLRSVDMLIGHGGHPGSGEGWKLDPARAGGGVLLDPGVHMLDLLLQLAPDAVGTDIQATRGFWPTGIEEDVVATFRAGALLASLRISHIRWVNTFRIELFGEDGYAIAEGRGGNYGEITLRTGTRWAWTDPGVAGQRESEEIQNFGPADPSFEHELRCVVEAWRAGALPAGHPRPATFAEARAIAELCDRLYAAIG